MTDELVFKEDDVEYMKLCFDLTVYWQGSVFDHQAGVTHFYREAINAIGHELKFFATETMSHAEPITAETLEILPQWLAEPDRTRDVLTLNLESNSVPDMPSGTALDFWATEYEDEAAGMIRLILPHEVIYDADEIIDLAKNLASQIQFHSGHGGFGINWDHKGEYAIPAKRKMAMLSRRFPAIDLTETMCTLMAIPMGLKRINWLTLVGDSLLNELPELDSLSERLGDEISIVNLTHGKMFVAGPEPTPGDVNRRQDLSNYYKVGAELASIRSQEHPPFLSDEKGMADEDLTAEWLAYFDQE